MNILYALLGWFAGVFSTLLLEWNRDRRLVKSLRVALRFELNEFRFRMAGVVFMLATRAGALSADRVDWLIKEFEAYKGFASPGDVLDALRLMKEHPTEAEQVSKKLAAQYSKGSPGLKKYPTPALDAAVASVALFPHEEQRKILELRTLVSNLESATDEAWRFFEMTFNSSLTQPDRQRVQANLEGAYAQAAQLCERIAEHAATMM